MKITLEIPDELFGQVEAQAAQTAQPISDFLLAAVRDKLVPDSAHPQPGGGWRSVFGAADPRGYGRASARH